MDEVEESLETYLLGNFRNMDPNVIGVILAQLDPQSALRLCQTSSEFNKICQKIKALDKKALAFIAHEAPLSVPVRNIAESASLIRRGFMTTYAVFWDEEQTLITSDDVQFGTPGQTDGEFALEIIGLPPPAGTRVWAFVDTDNAEGRIPYAEVYQTLQVLREVWKTGDSVFTEHFKNVTGESTDEQFDELLKGNTVYGFIIREVELP